MVNLLLIVTISQYLLYVIVANLVQFKVIIFKKPCNDDTAVLIISDDGHEPKQLSSLNGSFHGLSGDVDSQEFFLFVYGLTVL